MMGTFFTDGDLQEMRARARETRDLFRGVFANPNGRKVLEHLFDMFAVPFSDGTNEKAQRYAGRMDVLIYMLKNVNVLGAEEDKK